MPIGMEAGFVKEDASIADDTVDRAKGAHRGIGNLPCSRSLAEVSFDQSQPLHGFEFGLLDMKRIGDDVIAALDECLRDAGPNPARRTGHDHDLA